LQNILDLSQAVCVSQYEFNEKALGETEKLLVFLTQDVAEARCD